MRLPLLALLSGLAGPALAQTAISITSADMPVAADSLRLSQAAVLPATAPALNLNGANKTWNYAGLVPVAQRVERYGTVASLASGLQLLVFGQLGGVNKANLASPQDVGLGAGAGLPVSDGREFYNLSTNDFRSVGFGATLAGNALPVTYASQAQQDVIYHFPQTYGNAADVSNSYFTVAIPGTGSLSRKRNRSNQPDAWGTLTTPFGTFQTLRVVTTLNDRDSVAVGTTPGGPGVQLPTQKQYKWLAKTIHVPVLTITTTLTGGTERVSGIEYRDIYRKLTVLGTAAAAPAAGFACYPSPSAATEALRLTVPAGAGPLTITGRDVVGRQLFSKSVAAGSTEVTLDAASLGSYRGLLLLTLQTSQGPVTLRTVRQ